MSSSPIRLQLRLDPETAMTKCVTCPREPTEGRRSCECCRASYNRRYRANRDAGRCVCGQLSHVNYAVCKRCLQRQLHLERRYNGFKPKGMYVAWTTYGIKVGQSKSPSLRMRGLRYQTLAGLDRNVKFIKSYEGKGHLEKLVQHELAEYFVRLPNGRLSREILSCDLATVLATIDRVIAEDLLNVSPASSSASNSG